MMMMKKRRREKLKNNRNLKKIGGMARVVLCWHMATNPLKLSVPVRPSMLFPSDGGSGGHHSCLRARPTATHRNRDGPHQNKTAKTHKMNYERRKRTRALQKRRRHPRPVTVR